MRLKFWAMAVLKKYNQRFLAIQENSKEDCTADPNNTKSYDAKKTIILGVCNIDAYSSVLNFVFGQSSLTVLSMTNKHDSAAYFLMFSRTLGTA